VVPCSSRAFTMWPFQSAICTCAWGTPVPAAPAGTHHRMQRSHRQFEFEFFPRFLSTAAACSQRVRPAGQSGEGGLCNSSLESVCAECKFERTNVRTDNCGLSPVVTLYE